SLALVGGGVDSTGQRPGGDWVDRVAWDIVAIDDVFANPLGPANAIALASDHSLFIGENDRRQVVPRDTNVEHEPIDTPITMHDRVSPASTMVDLGSNGV